MNDVVIIGGGQVGRSLAVACERTNLLVLIVDDRAAKPDNWDGEWVHGRGVVSAKGLVAILDPASGDEKRIVQATAIVVAVGSIDAARPASCMLGITKAGAAFAPDGKSIVTDSHGRTRADGIYAVGSCASSATPDIVEDLIRYCASTSIR